MTDERLLRRNIVEQRTGLARSTIYSRMQKGRFPLPVRMSIRSVRWRESDINNYINNPSGWSITTPKTPDAEYQIDAKLGQSK